LARFRLHPAVGVLRFTQRNGLQEFVLHDPDQSRQFLNEDLRQSGVLALIGDTPLVPLRRLSPNPSVLILGKLEGQNPGGSIKARIALEMIEAAERNGQLNREKTILEATSGNTGIGLALVAAVKGYRILLAMSEAVSLERRKILSALGAEFLLTSAEMGTDGAIEEAYGLARNHREQYFLPDQFNNPANVEAHYKHTGPEIWRQTEGRITHFVAAMGTTGTLMGCSAYLKEKNSAVQIVGVEPYLGHKIQGLKNLKEAYVPGIYRREALDEKINVEDEAAFEMTRRLARKEGLFVGMSAGAAVHVAVERARQLSAGVMVVILPDGGERYLSTNLFVVPESEEAEPVESRLHLLNTFTRRKEVFEPLAEKKVVLYTCGPTLYRRPHLGLYRRLVLADVLRRHMESCCGFEVRHVVGLMDMDENVLAAADTAEIRPDEIARRVYAEFVEDGRTLNLLPAENAPFSSDNLEAMRDLTERLDEAGFAYEKLRSLYFPVRKYPEYGTVSGIDLAKIRPGATVDLDRYEKSDPRDFTLLRRSTLKELRSGFYAQTSWGNVSPSWHLQCAGLALSHCGERFDVHISGTDLIFPHHENTVAQIRAVTGENPSRFALHAELVLVEGKKMSRSLQTAVTVPELLNRGYSGRVIRYFLTTTHYRQPLRFSARALEEARAALHRLDDFIVNVSMADGSAERADEVEAWITELNDAFKAAMDDDLNVSAAMAAVFSFAKKVNYLSAHHHLGRKQAARIVETITALCSVLGFSPEAGCPAGPEISALVARRTKARAVKDYETADRIREDLNRRGIVLEDTPQGTRWRRRRPGDSAAILSDSGTEMEPHGDRSR
jgi:cysteinyl-tRNA synthetase